MDAGLFDSMLAERAARRPFAVVTRLRDGAQALVCEDSVRGDLVLDDAQLDETRRRTLADRSGALEGAGERADEALFVRCHARPPRLVVVGAVHITQALAPMAAMAGFEVHVIDPRRAFAAAERLPGVSVSTEWPDEAIRRIGIDARTAVVTLSHDPKLDDPALIAALRSRAFYIGALGSTRTHARRVARLTEAGLGDAIGRIHAPVGLDLGGRAPVEIAVAIVAQLIRARYAKPAQEPAQEPASAAGSARAA
ncbi:MAG: XdhC family protein [Burkholderiaceae bacterium]|nr:XdhC family protein [Burkholderiaceae bacterium]